MRNVEVTVRDNDTPGVMVTAGQPGTTIEDGATLVIEGDARRRGITTSSGQAREAAHGGRHRDRSLFDASQVALSATTITFTPGDWDDAQVVTVTAVQDGAFEDPMISVLKFTATAAYGAARSSPTCGCSTTTRRVS